MPYTSQSLPAAGRGPLGSEEVSGRRYTTDIKYRNAQNMLPRTARLCYRLRARVAAPSISGLDWKSGRGATESCFADSETSPNRSFQHIIQCRNSACSCYTWGALTSMCEHKPRRHVWDIGLIFRVWTRSNFKCGYLWKVLRYINVCLQIVYFSHTIVCKHT